MENKMRITEQMIHDIYCSEEMDFQTIYVLFKSKIKKFLKNKNYEVGFIKKTTQRKLFVIEDTKNLSVIETAPIKTMFFVTVGFYIKFENEKDFIKYKLKFS